LFRSSTTSTQLSNLSADHYEVERVIAHRDVHNNYDDDLSNIRRDAATGKLYHGQGGGGLRCSDVANRLPLQYITEAMQCARQRMIGRAIAEEGKDEQPTETHGQALSHLPTNQPDAAPSPILRALLGPTCVRNEKVVVRRTKKIEHP